MTVHHMRADWRTACGIDWHRLVHMDDSRDDDGTGEGVTCRRCLRWLQRREACSSVVLGFTAGGTVEELMTLRLMSREEVEDAIRRALSCR